MQPGVVKISEVVRHTGPFAAGDEVCRPACDMEEEWVFRIYAELRFSQDVPHCLA